MKFLKVFSVISILIIGGMYGWQNLFVSEHSHDVPAFNSIYTSGPINVYIANGNQPEVIIRADGNVHDQMTVEVVDGQLRIYNHDRIQHERVLDAYVTYQALDSVHAGGASTLTGRSIVSGDQVLIRASGAAEVKLQVHSDSLDLVMTGAANVQLAGYSDFFNLAIMHVGDLMAYNLETQHCKVVMDTGDQSPGIARINTVQTLDVQIVGPRHLKYKGDPEVTKSIEGSGEVIKY